MHWSSCLWWMFEKVYHALIQHLQVTLTDEIKISDRTIKRTCKLSEIDSDTFIHV